MAKSSDKAKEMIFNVLSKAFISTKLIDKKLYINIEVDGEPVQIAVSLTAPKTKVEFGTDFSKSETVKPQYTEEMIESQKKEVADIFDFFKL